MLKSLCYLVLAVCFMEAPSAFSQDASQSAPKVPLAHVIGTIESVDPTAQTITVQEDKTGTKHVIQLATTKTLLKVEPTAKDLAKAVRIKADDLQVGDRVDARGTKPDDAPDTLIARSVILMSGRDLEQTHQQQAAAWAHATSGKVIAVDPASGKITADVRAAGATKSVVLNTSSKTEFSRYDPGTGKAEPSQLAQIQVGDQVKVIGNKNDDGSLITADKVYSGAFRTMPSTITSIAADGKSMTVKDLATKKPVTVSLTPDVSIHKLTPMMAGFLARRLNPTAAGGGPNAGQAGGAGQPASGQGGGMPAGGPPSGGGNWNRGGEGGAPGAPGGGLGAGRGDISQMIEHTPTIALTDLKPGDAVVVSGVATGADQSQLLANTIIAGVEPILQAAPAQRSGGRDVGGDWGLGEMSAPQ